MRVPKIYDIKSKKASKKVMITAGFHGDEYTCIAIAHKIIDKARERELGVNLSVIPFINGFGFLNKTRESYDDVDLNRLSPLVESEYGKEARESIKSCIYNSDLYIDLHNFVYNINNLPVYSFKSNWAENSLFNKLHNLAKWGPKNTLKPEGRVKNTWVYAAHQQGIPAGVVEFAPMPFADENYIATHADNILGGLEQVFDDGSDPENKPRHKEFLKVYAESPGIWVKALDVKVGDIVKKGQLAGSLLNPLTGSWCEHHFEDDGVLQHIHTDGRIDFDREVYVLIEEINS